MQGGIVKIIAGFLGLALPIALATNAAPPQQDKGPADPPVWAYPINPPVDQPAPDDGSLQHVPGSSKALTRTQVLDPFNIPDWHPNGHLAMPDVVAHGRKPGVRGCGYCHLPNAQGRPENASLAGRSPSYLFRQLYDFQHGNRHGEWSPLMKGPVARLSEDDMLSIAAYLSSLNP